MFLKKLIEKPMLGIGILFMTLFLLDMAKQGKLTLNRTDKLIPTSCKAALVKLNRRIPATWSTKCEGNNMAVEISFETKKEFNKKELRPILFREMANNLIHIAKQSPSDNLERTGFIRVHLRHKDLKINALTEGRYLIKLSTIRTKRLIQEHLKATVQIQEVSQ